MSFRNPVTFSMIANRERQHRERISRVDKYSLGILPVAAVYGGNASGKTNLFKALSFAKSLVTVGTKPDATIPVRQFCLDASLAERPTRMVLEILARETVYELTLSVTEQEVLEERLVRINGNSEHELYYRLNGEIKFGSSLNKNKFMQYVFKGTRPNQLFITNAVSQNDSTFSDVHNWFKNSLLLIAPDSRFGSFEQLIDEGTDLSGNMSSLLYKLDTGITRIGGDEIPVELIEIPAQIREDIIQRVSDHVTVQLIDGDERIVFSRREGKTIANRLVSFHARADGTDAKFNIDQESDGSRRVIDLLPALLSMTAHGSNRVVVIDEIDRSMHTLLTRKLIESYLNTCSNDTRSQLLFTTHDVLLMDQRLFRRDEMWVTERDRMGVSELTSFNDFRDLRNDKDIRKSYLQGRMGGIPRFELADSLVASEFQDEISK